MSICLANLTLSFLTICKIITFKVEEKVFWPCPRGTTIFWDPKKPLSQVYMKCASLNLISRWIRYMSTNSHAHTGCETLRKSSISTRGYAEIYIQRWFFDNKNSIWKILGFKIQLVETCSSSSSTHRIFGGISKFRL